MSILKVLILLLIISSIVVDARKRRKRRQISSASYYISNVNPYSSSFNPTAPLTYSSGSYYSAPSYGYPNTGYSADRPFSSDNYGTDSYLYGSQYGYNVQNPYGTSQTYSLPNLGSTYGSGYPASASGLYNYGPMGFNNQYPNWNQGNSYQYYTGGTGTGLTNTGYYWYRSLRNSPFQGRPGENIANNNPAGMNPPVGMNPPAGMNPQVRPNAPGPIGPLGPPGPPRN